MQGMTIKVRIKLSYRLYLPGWSDKDRSHWSLLYAVPGTPLTIIVAVSVIYPVCCLELLHVGAVCKSGNTQRESNISRTVTQSGYTACS